jgi:hypothetical protein
MAMPLINGRIAAQAVKIPFPIHIPDKDTKAAVQNYRDGMIVVRAVSLLQFQVGAGQVGHRRGGRRSMHKKKNKR